MAEKNQLYYGDNLDVLRRYVHNESVDLVYVDPPFNPRRGYNVLFAEKDGSSYPRMQIFTVEQLLTGKQVEYPRYARDNTFKQAPRSWSPAIENMDLPLELPLNG